MEFDEMMDMVPIIHEIAKEKRAWQVCCVPHCDNTNLHGSMFHFPKVLRNHKGCSEINEPNVKR